MNVRSAAKVAGTVALVTLAIALTAFNASRYKRLKRFPPTQPRSTVAPGTHMTGPGIVTGSSTPQLSLTIFWDYECGTCSSLEPRLERLRNRYDRLQIVYRQLPLDYHTTARDIARGAICAAFSGQFLKWHRIVAKQGGGTFPEGSVSRLAVEAGITDSAGFQACLTSPATLAGMHQDSLTAVAVGADATPTIIVNGDVYTGIPWDFEAIVENHLKASGEI